MVVTMPNHIGFPGGKEDALQWFEISKSGPGQERENCVLCMSWLVTDPQGAGSIAQCVVHGLLLTHSAHTYSCDVPGTVPGAKDTAGNKANSLSSWDLHPSVRDRK